MSRIELLQEQAEEAFQTLVESIEGVDQAQSWAVLPNLGPDYLHSDGSIHGLVHHCAGCKRVQASIAFQNAEYRWNDLYEATKAIEPDWEKAVAFLHESHQYWLQSWRDLKDEELELMVPTNYKQDKTAYEMIRIMTNHDIYHAGQIAVLRYGVGPSDTPPPSAAQDILTYCKESKYW